MITIQILLYIAMMATAWPVGWALAWLCKEELVSGGRWFKRIIYVLLGIGIITVVLLLLGLMGLIGLMGLTGISVFAFVEPSMCITILLTIVYMILITAVSLYKGKDKKFLK